MSNHDSKRELASGVDLTEATALGQSNLPTIYPQQDNQQIASRRLRRPVIIGNSMYRKFPHAIHH